MDTFLIAQYSWRTFFVFAIILTIVYLLLRFLNQLLGKVNFLGRFQNQIQNIVYYIYRAFLPIILLYLIAVFILIKPTLHGVISLLCLVLGFHHLRNAISGIILRFEKNLTVGKEIKTLDLDGIIEELGLFGLKINTSAGVSFVSYHNLVRDGYTLASGDEVGRLLQMQLESTEGEASINHLNRLQHLLSSSPYLDWQHPPKLVTSNTAKNIITSTLLIKEESHLSDLKQSIEEWGYTCEILN